MWLPKCEKPVEREAFGNSCGLAYALIVGRQQVLEKGFGWSQRIKAELRVANTR